MKIGFIGLGRMGKNMVYNLLDHKHKVVAHNRSPKPVKEVSRRGAMPAYSVEELCSKLGGKQKIVWIMIKAGKPVDAVIKSLLPFLKKDDIIIDGGNSFYQDSLRRGKMLKKKGIHFFDIGVSGGMDGARHGACMMAGGNSRIFKKIEPLLRDMCVKDGYGLMGKAGAGHFVKMVHNGIEYGMMAAIAEGMQALKRHEKKFDLKLQTAAKVYANGSIIESKLVSWLLEAMAEGLLEKVKGSVPKGETEDEMKKLEKLSNMPILHNARLMRAKSRKKTSYAGKVMAAMRNKFGGHAVVKK